MNEDREYALEILLGEMGYGEGDDLPTTDDVARCLDTLGVELDTEDQDQVEAIARACRRAVGMPEPTGTRTVRVPAWKVLREAIECGLLTGDALAAIALPDRVDVDTVESSVGPDGDLTLMYEM